MPAQIHTHKMKNIFKDDPTALLKAQYTLLSGINAYPDFNQTINQFAKTCIDNLSLSSAHIYSLELIRDSTSFDNGIIKNVKILNHTTIPQQEKPNKPEKQALAHIINRFLMGKDPLKPYFDDTHYFGFILCECKKLVIFNNAENIASDQINELFKQSIEKLDHLSRVVALTVPANNTNSMNEHESSYHVDQLTQLPDRRKFKYSLLKTLSNAIRLNHFGAVVYLNIDNFKFINNSLGHSTGDMIINKIAGRLKQLCRTGDDLYRMGGDEFVFVLNHLGDHLESAAKKARSITDRIIKEMNIPVQLGDKSLHLTSSIGISMFPSTSLVDNDSESILKQANMAMYNAKKKGKNCLTFYNQELQQTADDYFIIFNQLTTALEKYEFSLVYQPMVDINQNIIGAEALIRWNNSELGNVPPSKFIHLTEESHLILEIGDWVLQTACEFIKKIKTLNPPGMEHFKYISVNVSPKQLSHPGFVNSTHQKIINTGINPADIRLEFTESMLVDDIESTINVMKQLKDNNIKFLLDDFGTGYSSLSYLCRLPISAIKIDKTFVSGDDNSEVENKLIVETIIAMSEKMGLNCIVEGVETKQSADYFIEKNVYAIQGYYYHKPVSGKSLLELLEDNNNTVDSATPS